MARSSPKFGNVTTIPSICSRCFLNSSAQRAASWRVSTAPNLDSLSSRTIGLIPLAVSAEIMSRRPERARWSGKNPRFPTMTPSTIGAFSGCVMAPLSGIFCKRLHAAHYCSFRISVKRPLYAFPSLFLSAAWLFEAVYLKRRLGH